MLLLNCCSFTVDVVQSLIFGTSTTGAAVGAGVGSGAGDAELGSCRLVIYYQGTGSLHLHQRRGEADGDEGDELHVVDGLVRMISVKMGLVRGYLSLLEKLRLERKKKFQLARRSTD